MAHFINYNPYNMINNINYNPINPINPNDELANHQPTRLKKHRLFLELEYLESNYQEVNVTMIRGKETIIEAKYPLQAIPKHIKFIIPNNYPFKAPEVYIIKNIGSYKSCEFVEENYLYTIHNCQLPRIQSLIKKIRGEDSIHTCLKCKSSLSYDNWSPAFKMNHIFDEISKNNKLKRRVSIEIGLEDLFKKYQQLPKDLMEVIISYI
jgi:ubiquitin-protein ligase